MKQQLSHLSLLLLLLLCVALSQAPDADAARARPVNIVALNAKKGCATFSSLLTSTTDAAQTYASNVDSGLTVFCPMDQAIKSFLPKFKNLTADGKLSLLLYHALPVYMSIPMLRTSNGVYVTVAAGGIIAKNYNLMVQNEGKMVTLKTRLSVATIMSTIFDMSPIAVYTVDEVLQPWELFNPANAPRPGLEATNAAALKGAKSKKAKPVPVPSRSQSSQRIRMLPTIMAPVRGMVSCRRSRVGSGLSWHTLKMFPSI